MNVERSSLPGIGRSYRFTTAQGRCVGVIVHRNDGRYDLAINDPDNADRGCSIRLTRVEAATLAGLLSIVDLADINIVTTDAQA
ncbi:potassium transporter TrkA [Dactylosporangium sp. NPDC048998]|uniref:potassium transporter TrkA n=1 Tax=Dactylosporangium sp. NPDC048998 TaxID=3363976 RepID=UPI0037182101